MSIVSKIKESVESACGMPFYYDTPQTLNVRLEMAEFPCAMMHIVESGAVTDTNGIIRERLTISVLFAQQSSLDFDGIDVEENELDEMKQAAFKWLLALQRSHELRLISTNGTQRYYATDDCIFSAYAANVTIEEVQGVSICDIS